MDQGAREMHAGRHRIGAQQLIDQGAHRNATAPLEPLANFADARAAALQHLLDLRLQRRRLGRKTEAEHMQRLAAPAASQFDTRDKANTRLLAGRLCLVAARDTVMVCQRQQIHAVRGRMLNQGGRAEGAIGVMTMSMKIETQSPRMIANMLDWSEIDSVFLDLDGTLLDLAYDNYIWLARIPELYAERHGLSVPEAQAALAPKFRQWAGKIEWYSIEFWDRETGLDITRIHREEAARVSWLPGARGFLETVRERGKRLVLMTNSHPLVLAIKHERTNLLDYFDAAFSSAQFGAPKEDQAFWRAAARAEPFEPSRTLFCDDNRHVLRAAQLAGIGFIRAVRHADSSREPHRHEEFEAIDAVVDLI